MINYDISENEKANLNSIKLIQPDSDIKQNFTLFEVELVKTIDCGDFVFCYLCLHEETFKNHILIGTAKGSILLYSIETSRLIKTFQKHEMQVKSLIDLSNYKEFYYASGGFDKIIKIFDLNRLEPVQILRNDDMIICMRNLAKYESNSFIAGFDSGYIKLFSSCKTSSKFSLSVQNRELYEKVSDILHIFDSKSNYNYIIMVYDHGQILLLNTYDLSVKRYFDKESQIGDQYNIKYYKDDLFITKCNIDKNVKIWSIYNSSSIYSFNNLNENVFSIEVISNKDVLVCSLSSDVILFLDLNTKIILKTLTTKRSHCLYRFCESEKYQLMCTDDAFKLSFYSLN